MRPLVFVGIALADVRERQRVREHRERRRPLDPLPRRHRPAMRGRRKLHVSELPVETSVLTDHIVADKFDRGLPLYPQEEELEDTGIRSTGASCRGGAITSAPRSVRRCCMQ
jgi:hypothetical protein